MIIIFSLILQFYSSYNLWFTVTLHSFCMYDWVRVWLPTINLLESMEYLAPAVEGSVWRFHRFWACKSTRPRPQSVWSCNEHSLKRSNLVELPMDNVRRNGRPLRWATNLQINGDGKYLRPSIDWKWMGIHLWPFWVTERRDCAVNSNITNVCVLIIIYQLLWLIR